MRSVFPFVALVVLSLLSRWPALANPDTTNSDVALVGLQARHVLQGELSPLLFGSHYQTSVDSFVAAAFFAVIGATPFALMFSALALHIALTLMVYAMLARTDGVGQTRAFVVTLLLVFTGAAVHSYALYPPRQAALTLAVAALFALDAATRSERRAPMFAGLGAALGGLALFADPYALLFLPALLVTAAFVLARRPNRASGRWQTIAAIATGAGLGAVPLLLLATHPEWKRGETTLSFSVLAKNARIFVDTCGPWAFGTSVYRPTLVSNYEPWIAPLGVRFVQVVGGTLLAATAFLAPLAALLPRIRKASSLSALRHGVVGGVLAWTTLGGFLLSVMVMDHFSMRYLAAAILATPLCLAPLAAVVSMRTLAVGIAPMLVAGLVGGFASFGPVVSGLRLAHLPGHDDELALLADLDALGVRDGVADYWVSYRLTFLARERLVVVPTHASQDRYAPYRKRVEQASVHAYIVDPYRSQETRETVETRLRAAGPIRATLERGAMTAFVVDGPVPARSRY